MDDIDLTPTHFITKSRFRDYLKSPRILWDRVHNPEGLPPEDGFAKALMAEGNEADRLFPHSFGDFIDCQAPTETNVDPLLITQEALAHHSGRPLSQASISNDNLLARIDMLRPREDGMFDLIEFKAKTKFTRSGKESPIPDVAFQYYLAKQCGIPVATAKIAHFNPDYVRGDSLDLQGLFMETDVTEEVDAYLPDVELLSKRAKEVLACKTPPEIDPCSESCLNLDKEEFFHYVPEAGKPDSVFNIPSIRRDKAIKLAAQTKNSDVPFSVTNTVLETDSHKTLVFAECMAQGKIYFDREAAKEFLSSIKFPFVGMDFETMMHGVPRFKGASPNSQVPFQACILTIAEPGAPIEYIDHLADHRDDDPRRGVLEAVAIATRNAGTALAYNASFELSCLERASSLADEMGYGGILAQVPEKTVDLGKLFMGYKIFSPEQKSASLKQVSAAFYKENPYVNSEVHAGDQASFIFTEMVNGNIEPAKIEPLRKALIEYCRHDVQVMVDGVGLVEVLAGIPKEEQRFVPYMKAEIRDDLPEMFHVAPPSTALPKPTKSRAQSKGRDGIAD
jgi:hypothetical protein